MTVLRGKRGELGRCVCNCQESRSLGRAYGSFCLVFPTWVSSQEAVAQLTTTGPQARGIQEGGVWGCRPWESQTLKELLS